MNKKQVLEIIQAITTYYPNFKMDDPKATVNAWYEILKDYEFDNIVDNLKNYVKSNRFAPSVADIIELPPSKDRAIPTYEETKELFVQWDNERDKSADDEAAKTALEKMREILGINRG